jgi:hypothetical protein
MLKSGQEKESQFGLTGIFVQALYESSGCVIYAAEPVEKL